MKTFKIAPSSLSFLWEECPRCFWRKANGVQEAKDNNVHFALGNVFDAAAKKAMTPEVVNTLGAPVLDYEKSEAEWITSQPIEFEDLGVSIYFNGKTDRRYMTDDGSAFIMDFKAGIVSNFEKYSLAMHAYLWGIENPSKGVARPVDGMGLICMSIDESNPFHMKGNRCSIKGHLVYHAIEVDRSKFLDRLRPIAQTLSMQTPPEAGFWCRFCQTVESAKALDMKKVAA